MSVNAKLTTVSDNKELEKMIIIIGHLITLPLGHNFISLH